MNLENLVFEGGGVKGIAYAGGIQSLKSHGLLENIERVACISGRDSDDQKKLYESGIKYTDDYIKKHDLVGQYRGSYPVTSS